MLRPFNAHTFNKMREKRMYAQHKIKEGIEIDLLPKDVIEDDIIKDERDGTTYWSVFRIFPNNRWNSYEFLLTPAIIRSFKDEHNRRLKIVYKNTHVTVLRLSL